MNAFLPKSIDALFRRWPALLIISLGIAALFACAALIGVGNHLLVYEGF